MAKSIFLAVVFGIFLNLNAGASMVSFFVIETGLPEEGGNNRHSQYWESAFMDVFFDAGHIVCNFPIQRLQSKPEGEILRAISFDMDDARSAGVDFVFITYLDYNPDSMMPAEISFFIFKVNSREKILERRIAGKTYGSTREEVDDLKSIVRGLVPFIRE
jgi:hypothetical protein